MEQWLNLLEETKAHFKEGARFVKAYTNDKTYIIKPANEAQNEYWITEEEPGFPRTKTRALDDIFREVFGIEATY